MSCVSLVFCFKVQNCQGEGAFIFNSLWLYFILKIKALYLEFEIEVQTLECSEYQNFAITMTSTKTSSQRSFSCQVPKTRKQILFLSVMLPLTVICLWDDLLFENHCLFTNLFFRLVPLPSDIMYTCVFWCVCVHTCVCLNLWCL